LGWRSGKVVDIVVLESQVSNMTKLYFGFTLLVSLVSTLVWLNPSHCISPDSAVYLRIATDFSVYDGTFPIGYPALIRVVSGLTGLAPIWASKIVNLLAVGVSVGLWAKRLGTARAGWLLSVWLLGQFVRIVAFTWSETVFLVLLAEVIWAIFQCQNQPDSWHFSSLVALLITLFLVRYVGGFMCVVLLIYTRKIPQFIIISLLAVLFIVGYFALNQHLTGSVWGGSRFGAVESPGVLAGLFGRALLNESLVVRDVISGKDTTLVWVGLAVQITWVVLAVRKFYQRPARRLTAQTWQLARLFLITAGVYVVVLFALRTLSPFDAPNARLMAPATFCGLWAGLLWLTEQPDYQQHFRWYWLALVVVSWLALVPYQ
jgi:hypothetical protein